MHRFAATLKLRAGPADHLNVRTTHRFLLPFTALSALALCIVALLPGRADAHLAFVQTGPATDVTATTATLTGQIKTFRRDQAYYFEYGVTTAYGARTPQQSVTSFLTAASAPVTGLTPGTVYHYRLVAIRPRHSDEGADGTFTTAAAPVAAPSPEPPPAAALAPAPAAAGPTLGQSVAVAPVKGSVTVKVPGAATYTPLGGGATVPVGAVLDTRRGTVELTTAVEGGATQTATFHSGVFEVRQPANGHGLTDIVLRGPALSCPRVRRSGKATARAAAAQTKKSKKRKRQLWARDNGGRFRTHGKNSVATVRGTSWVTTDTCAGTRTTVREGAVSVRDTHRHRTVLVRAGKSYLARRR
jgi:hypothetical protein